MNNEPVAWMQTYKNEPNNIAWTKKDLEELGESIDYSYIPLYTHPVKELTDEKITQCLNESMDIKGVWGQPMLELNPVNFARAILRKAQEK